MENSRSQKISSGARGVGLRTVHYGHVLENLPKDVEWFEVISENFMFSDGNPIRVLEKVRGNYPIACHGVGLGIGNHEPLRQDYLIKLKELIARFEPFVVSDHLCWTRFGKHNSHDLLPVAFTEPNLKLICEKISGVQDFLGRQIAIENPSAYAAFAHADMCEAEFMSELVRQTGCGVLLDVNNLFVNYSNLSTNILNYFEFLKPDAVKQFHIAGHCVNTCGDGMVRIDTHDHPASDEAIQLLQLARNRWPDAPILLEWDDHIPEWPELMSELNRVTKKKKISDEKIQSIFVQSTEKKNSISQVKIEETFFSMATQQNHLHKGDERLDILDENRPVAAIRGINVYQNAYWMRLIEVMGDIFPLSKKFLGEENFGYFCRDYLEAFPSVHDSISFIGDDVGKFLESQFEQNSNLIGKLSVLMGFELKKWLLFGQKQALKRSKIEDFTSLSEEGWNDLCVSIAPPFSLESYKIDLQTLLKDLESEENIWGEKNYDQPSQALVWQFGTTVNWRFLDSDQFQFLEHVNSGKKVQEFFGSSSHEEVQQRLGFLLELVGESAIVILSKAKDLPE